MTPTGKVSKARDPVSPPTAAPTTQTLLCDHEEHEMSVHQLP
jgi:hypothetical protein